MTATLETEAEFRAFRARIWRRPRDWTARLVFADWLQERDDPRAAGWRFSAERKLLPVNRRVTYASRFDVRSHQWIQSETDRTGGSTLRGRLYRAVHALEPFCRHPRPLSNDSVLTFGARLELYFSTRANRVSLFDALDAVARAYATIPERFRGLL